MKNEARAVVIGGGIVGVAVLYHLTKLGWKDVVLVERKQLTAGSTWHAAAGFHSLNGSVNMARLQAYSIQTYDEVAEISGQDIGIHRVGTCTTAATPERWDFLKIVDELNTTLGIDSWLIDASEIPKYSRLTDHTKLIGALIDPADGYLDPYGATHAYAKAARIAGAEIYQETLVTALEQRDDKTWDVITEKGTINTEHVINAAGLWAREVGQMAGLDLPLIPYEHHYLVTEQIPEVMAQDKESLLTVDLDGGIYVREEVGGLLFGVYEPNPIPWSLNGTPWSFGSELLEPRLEHLEGSLEKGFERFPLMHEAGIKNAINGPFTFTPDGNPLMGPVRGVPNYWLACGCMAGFSQSGGVALALAQWIIDGETEEDTFSMDPARFGSFANEAYTLETSTQFYEWRFRVAFPNETWPGGSPGPHHADLRSPKTGGRSLHINSTARSTHVVRSRGRTGGRHPDLLPPQQLRRSSRGGRSGHQRCRHHRYQLVFQVRDQRPGCSRLARPIAGHKDPNGGPQSPRRHVVRPSEDRRRLHPLLSAQAPTAKGPSDS